MTGSKALAFRYPVACCGEVHWGGGYMTVNTEKINGLCKMRIEGEMTIFNAADLKKDLLDTLNECSELEMDLSQVNEIDTTGLQLLVLTRRESAALNKSCRIIAYSPATMSVLELFNMKEYFTTN
jgi:anti-sigma B factor antagonist